MRERDARMRKLTPAQEDEVRKAFDSGALGAGSLAQRYGVTVRTIYRTVHRAHRETVSVAVGPYIATYEVGDEGPIQLTPWRAA